MAKYLNLEEEVKIDVDSGERPGQDVVNVILRNPRNEDFKFVLDKTKVKLVKDFKQEIMNNLKLDKDKAIKMFFKGKPLIDTNSMSDLKLSDRDVILFMVSEAPKQEENEISIFTQNSDIENSHIEENLGHNLELNRGFNRFRDFGVDPAEIHILRILFHTAHLAQRRENIENVNWTPEAVLNREEEWLNSNNPSFPNPRNAMGGGLNPFGFYILRRNHRRNGFPLQNSIRNRTTHSDFDDFLEPDSRFFLGIVCGILLNVFSIIFLLFCTFRPKFRMGLKLGMVIGVMIFFMFYFN